MRLFEKYRPKSLDEVIGQPKAVATLRGIREREGWGGRAYWISGASGTGKTTLARIIAAELADPFNTTEWGAGDQLTSADLDDVERMFRLSCLGVKPGRAWIVNEAHGLRKPIVRRLLGLLEEGLPQHSAVIFTTTRDGQDALFEDDIDAHPLLSRCTVLPLTNQGLAKAFAARAREIAAAEGMDGVPESRYVALAQDVRNNFRAMLQRIGDGQVCA